MQHYVCSACGAAHIAAALDRYGRPVCAACACATLRTCPDLFGRLPRAEPPAQPEAPRVAVAEMGRYGVSRIR